MSCCSTEVKQAFQFAFPTITKFYIGHKQQQCPLLSPCKSWRFIIAESQLYDAESHNCKQLDKLKALSMYTSHSFVLVFFNRNKRLLLLNFYIHDFIN